VKTAYIAAAHPLDVAREVEREVAQGCRSFVLRPIAGGGMLDQERLGAARYAAGVHSEVVLDPGVVAVAR
jgi:L-alanine-DL-glutamate epimerase-like enolase superfamily enzyme